MMAEFTQEEQEFHDKICVGEDVVREKKRQAQRRFNERHPERRKAMNTRWKQNNPGKIRASARRRYALDPTKDNERSNAWKKANRERCNNYSKQYAIEHSSEVRAKQRTYMLKTKYKLTPEDWDQLFAAQEFSCAICGSEYPNNKNGRWHTDHDHKTGVVRGILCNNCNHLLGQAKDNKDTLFSAIEYLGGYDE